MLTIGLDPGFTGALAVLDTTGALVGLYDTPVLRLQTGKTAYDVPGMAALLRPYTGQPGVYVVLEQAQGRPGQGIVSTFSTGWGFGLWQGIVTTLDLPLTLVRPATWKRSVGLSSDKEQARLRAQQRFPGADLRHKKDHGRAEALLLAWWGWRGTRPGAQC